jgi:hypothetical protein
MDHLTMQTKEGIDIQEATGIHLSNSTILSAKTNPVIYALNSDQIFINALKYASPAAVLLQAQGIRTNKISITNTDASKANTKSEIGFGADASSISIK